MSFAHSTACAMLIELARRPRTDENLIRFDLGDRNIFENERLVVEPSTARNF